MSGGLSTCSCLDKYSVQHPDDPRGPGPFYFFRGSNGAEIVSSYCESRGWKRIYNKNREDFKLKWCETKSSVNYCNFREGEQLLYQIPNNKVLTTKIGLLSSLREYERVCSKVNHGRGLRRLKMEEFIPTTFRMDVREEREAFFGHNSESCMWICKPTGLNQGRGIFLLKSQDDIDAFRLKLQHMEESQANKMHHCQPQARIVQHYIQNPLLLKGKKFDVRSYLLIACTAPYMVFFRHGYVRLTCDLYDPSSSKLSDHLTNQHMQKKNPLYSQLKEDTVWSMESFNAYVNHRFQVAKGLPRDWVLGAFAKHMQRIMTQCFFAVKSKLDRRLGLFDLIGCDFMVDEDFKVWLLEMNCNPALHTNCEVLKEVIPSTVAETLGELGPHIIIIIIITLHFTHQTLRACHCLRVMEFKVFLISLLNRLMRDATEESSSGTPRLATVHETLPPSGGDQPEAPLASRRVLLF
uniref:Tubulin tyrosine ligase-like family, member 10 n=1 Tax=Scophthalmus maximus TaxID=52904 RepID=A0A8D3BKV7_SCOMX